MLRAAEGKRVRREPQKGERAMATKQIYVKDADLPLFEQAEQLGGESLSAVIAEALRRFVDLKRAEAEGFKEVELQVGPDDHLRTVRFVGRKLAGTRILEGKTSERNDRGTDVAVYQGQAGKLLVYVKHWTCWQGERDHAWRRTFDSFQILMSGKPAGYIGSEDGEHDITLPGDLVDDIEAALGQEVGEYIEI